MEDLEKEFDKIKIKPDDNENDKKRKEESGGSSIGVEENEEESEKISNRKLRYLKMKDKKEEKINKKKQSSKTNSTNNTKTNQNDDKNINTSQSDLKDDNNNNQNNTTEDAILNNESMHQPIQVEYCKVCGVPYEYCEYGNSFNECKEENKDKYNYDMATNNTDNNNKKQAKKPSQNTSQKITIQKTTKAKKKTVTVVKGLHVYTKLDKMAKIFSKFYACGASVIKGTNNAQDQIDIQGDVEHNIVDVIMKNCPEITDDIFVILPPK
ncbi:translation initiation factor SUI1, putative [Plasmodium yoelii]|uniref:Translation initiation factor SUI1, putative n=1 Tax=Plasmodium yoelii TaxID=5861 RepID=A0A077YBT3_PLAYE|nr:translation initiation factor SUI1, putative [Plasmodium yoelii]CDU20609.1 translation initiation factor SUI1, putative [Plasmodium yoelii]VTZ81570.1 translation initiation factor SUI1, putative [Plasmodium yoelii]|eukprot:XP_022812898.1 translation initiation factor SUI1, putative [Plasmodium yoelii]